ncbi:MAG: 3-oxoacyl-acyl-carrier protein reductase [Nitrospirae bacterium]|nr:MAG: 3-oxoacyl-acyl-carrier protein reductase [Nitrospirota bacterium]
MSKPKTVLITGASRGLGRSLSLAIAKAGHNVVIHGRDEKRLYALKGEIAKYNVACEIVSGDIVEGQTIQKLTDCANRHEVDVLINNAGDYLGKSVSEMSISEFRKIIEVNLIAPVILTKKIFELFKKRKFGLIVNINSLAGKNFSDLEAAYSAGKHGLRGFMGSFQFEALRANVLIINIYSGAMSTDMSAGRKDHDKFIDPDEMADVICKMLDGARTMRIGELDILRRIY